MKTYEMLAHLMLWKLRNEIMPDAPPRERMSKEEISKEDKILKQVFAAKHGMLFEDYLTKLRRQFESKKQKNKNNL